MMTIQNSLNQAIQTTPSDPEKLYNGWYVTIKAEDGLF